MSVAEEEQSAFELGLWFRREMSRLKKEKTEEETTSFKSEDENTSSSSANEDSSSNTEDEINTLNNEDSESEESTSDKKNKRKAENDHRWNACELVGCYIAGGMPVKWWNVKYPMECQPLI